MASGCMTDHQILNIDRDRALTLANEAEAKDGLASTAAVVARARHYLGFLRGTRDAEIVQAAQAVAAIVRREPEGSGSG
jgi:hypothetical protein